MTPDEHVRRAEALTSRALSSSMTGWLHRSRRQDLLAAARVHALLALRQPDADHVPAALLHEAEREREQAVDDARTLREALAEVDRALDATSAAGRVRAAWRRSSG